MTENSKKGGSPTENDTEQKKRAMLVGAAQNTDTVLFRTEMKELDGLAGALGLETADTVTQSLSSIDAATCIGSGKVEELRGLLFEEKCDCVIFNNTLSPSQMVNLSDRLDTEVIDRTGLILEIFGRRAHTAEASMQVEYARLQYMLPRLAGMRKNLSRQGGTGGAMSNKGAGETQIELDRRRIEKRMSELRRKLKEVDLGRDVQRSRRRRAGLPLVSLVGYTNAGKSTLMNALISRCCPDDSKLVLEKDMLFATLDTTVRKITPEGRAPFLLSDTVGFISDLPHDLVNAFRSTLEEARLADLILEVVDCSDANCGMQMEVTAKTLADLDIRNVPVIFVMNKADLLMKDIKLPVLQADPQGERIYLSAKQGAGLDELTALICDRLSARTTEAAFLIPYTDGRSVEELHRRADILEEEYRDGGTYIRAAVPEDLLGRLSDYIL
ncbi:MAG: GTPase HflX [Lachnospiraceae bacterium]|jgi:GTP-binding protein HflX|nr:GTPase HflX [Lachnospiraceae bacterium]